MLRFCLRKFFILCVFPRTIVVETMKCGAQTSICREGALM